jgi:hypothetical protein
MYVSGGTQMKAGAILLETNRGGREVVHPPPSLRSDGGCAGSWFKNLSYCSHTAPPPTYHDTESFSPLIPFPLRPLFRFDPLPERGSFCLCSVESGPGREWLSFAPLPGSRARRGRSNAAILILYLPVGIQNRGVSALICCAALILPLKETHGTLNIEAALLRSSVASATTHRNV